MYKINTVLTIFKEEVANKDKVLKIVYEHMDYIIIKGEDNPVQYGDLIKVETTEFLLNNKEVIHYIDPKQIRNIVVMDNVIEDIKSILDNKKIW